MSNNQHARDLAETIMSHTIERGGLNLPDLIRALVVVIDAAEHRGNDAAWREGVEAAVKILNTNENRYLNNPAIKDGSTVYAAVLSNQAHCLNIAAKAIRALLPPVTAPGRTDLMVAPESIDTFMEATPLPDEDPERKITREEMIELFGEEIPMEAIKAVWYAPDGSTIGQVRAKIREIARNKSKPAYDAPDTVGALARLFAHGWQNAHLDFDKAHKLGLLTCVGVGRYIISDMGSAALALARRGDGG